MYHMSLSHIAHSTSFSNLHHKKKKKNKQNTQFREKNVLQVHIIWFSSLVMTSQYLPCDFFLFPSNVPESQCPHELVYIARIAIRAELANALFARNDENRFSSFYWFFQQVGCFFMITILLPSQGRGPILVFLVLSMIGQALVGLLFALMLYPLPIADYIVIRLVSLRLLLCLWLTIESQKTKPPKRQLSKTSFAESAFIS